MILPISVHNRFLARLAQRYRARAQHHRRLPWFGYTLSALNVIAIAFFVFDAALGRTAKDLPHRLVTIAGDITDIGKLATILTVTVTVIAVSLLIGKRLSNVRRRYRMAILTQMAIYLSLSVVAASVTVHILKLAIGRARPLLYDSTGIFRFDPFNGGFLYESFPSGHSAHVGAVFVALALLFPRFRLLFVGLGLWLGATRIIIGVHYPSDVMAGLALGAWFAFATAVVFARYGIIFTLSPEGWPRPRFIGMTIFQHSARRR